MEHREILKELHEHSIVPLSIFDLAQRVKVSYWELKRICQELQEKGLVKLYHNRVLITEKGLLE